MNDMRDFVIGYLLALCSREKIDIEPEVRKMIEAIYNENQNSES